MLTHTISELNMSRDRIVKAFSVIREDGKSKSFETFKVFWCLKMLPKLICGTLSVKIFLKLIFSNELGYLLGNDSCDETSSHPIFVTFPNSRISKRHKPINNQKVCEQN